MVSDKGKAPGPAGASNTERGSVYSRSNKSWNRFYGILLLFVVGAGIPLASVPSLRNSLVTRVAALKEAIMGKSGPVAAEIGEDSAPFPEEYERFISEFHGPEQSFPKDGIYAASSDGAFSKIDTPPALITPESAKSEAAPAAKNAKEALPSSESGDSGISYVQGEIEKEAYALLVQSNPKVEEMIKGGDPSLKFLSWGGSKRSEDTYWVRLLFQTGESRVVEYIWQVEVSSNRVLPLNHNARSIY